MQYFHDCKDAGEAKSKFRKLAKEHHPDIGGDEATMKEIQRQYDAFGTHSQHANIHEQAFRQAADAFHQNGFGFSTFKFNGFNRPSDNMFQATIEQLKTQISILNEDIKIKEKQIERKQHDNQCLHKINDDYLKIIQHLQDVINDLNNHKEKLKNTPWNRLKRWWNNER
jgi:curved DNA-binding protein CbpA